MDYSIFYRKGVIKMYCVDENYIIRVGDYMEKDYPRPRLKRTVLVTGWKEFLPIIGVDVGRCQ